MNEQKIAKAMELTKKCSNVQAVLGSIEVEETFELIGYWLNTMQRCIPGS